MKRQSSFMRGFSESYLADLGRVIAAWSAVEQSFLTLFLSFVVMRGARSGSLRNERVKTLMGAGLKEQVNDFKQRLKELDITPQKLSAAISTLDRVHTLRGERDRVAHSVFTLSLEDSDDGQVRFAQDEAIATFISWKKDFTGHDVRPLKQTKLKDIFERMDSLYWELANFSLDPELRAQRPRPT